MCQERNIPQNIRHQSNHSSSKVCGIITISFTFETPPSLSHMTWSTYLCCRGFFSFFSFLFVLKQSNLKIPQERLLRFIVALWTLSSLLCGCSCLCSMSRSVQHFLLQFASSLKALGAHLLSSIMIAKTMIDDNWDISITTKQTLRKTVRCGGFFVELLFPQGQ